MVERKQLVEDSRFFLDEFNLDRIYRENIKAYEIIEMPVGNVLRQYKKKIMPLYETDVYRFLSRSKKSEEAYQQYCDNIGMKRRSIESYFALIDAIKKNGYDIYQGAIVVDQHNLILEGQHRCCILLKLFGAAYKIKVVRFCYSERIVRPRFYLKLFCAKVKNFYYRFSNEKK